MIALLRIVDRGLIMSIELIYYWLLAIKNYQKALKGFTNSRRIGLVK